MTQAITIADDLTGANVNASLLAAHGFSAATCAFCAQWDAAFFAQYDAVSINTASRLLPPAQARQAVYAATRQALELQPCILSKRIDSTLRGNLGCEIEGALDAMNERPHQDELPDLANRVAQAVAIVCPAYPASQRIVVEGYMIVEAVPLQQTQVARDPTNPLRSSHVPTLLAEQSALPQQHIHLASFLEGEAAVLAALLQGIASGARLLVCDAVTDADIHLLSKALCALPPSQPLLLVDPGPLTAAFARHKLGPAAQHLDNRALLTVGSVMEIVRRQMDRVRLNHDMCLVRADCRLLACAERRQAEIDRVQAALGACPESCRLLCVCTALQDSDVVDIYAIAAAAGLEPAIITHRINSALAEITKHILQQPSLRIGGLFTSGGEITLAVTEALQAIGFSVRDEVLPRAIYGRLIGGLHHGLPMITKGGFAGDELAMARCVDYLFTKISTNVVLDQQAT